MRRVQGRLAVEGVDCLRGAETIARVFGAASTIPAIRVRDDLTTTTQTVGEVAEEIIEPNQSSAVDARRTGNHPGPAITPLQD